MKKLFKYILIGFVGLLVLGAVFGGSSKDKGTENKATTKPEAQKAPEVQKVEILTFVKEFDENQLSAEDKYKGKYVEFSGYIKNISEDITGSPYLSINPKPDQYYFGTYVQCFFKDKSELTALKNGQKITVQGKVDSQTLGNILIKDCKVVTQ
ncbi:MAG: hypothetical protein AAB546_00605 [Patescibacteria group bacterium]